MNNITYYKPVVRTQITWANSNIHSYSMAQTRHFEHKINNRYSWNQPICNFQGYK